MASDTLPVLSHPSFPQVFDAAMLSEIRRIPSARTHLVQCYFADEFCNCKELATVHDLKSEQDFCLRHFQMVEVERG
jgi:hypothetical protein